jgi:nucleotide-binding universal stress UspA family protein
MRYTHVLAPTDFSALGDLAVERAVEIAHDQGARLTLLHVLPAPPAPSPLVPHYYKVTTDDAQLEKAKSGAIARLRERVRADVRDGETIAIAYEVSVGDPSDEILAADASMHPDLIVIATHGRRGVVHFVMGSVSERVLRGARADVLAVRARAPESAVTSGDD